MKMINKTPNGQITFCEGHNCYHIEFGNLLIHLLGNEMEKLRTYLETVNPHYYEELNRYRHNRRKILLCLGDKKIYLSLSLSEFVEFKELLSLQCSNGILKSFEITGLTSYN